MSISYGNRSRRRAAASTREVAVFRGFWGAFQEWRAHRMLRATLLGLSEWELPDIGMAPSEIDYVASQKGFKRRYGADTLLLLLLCTALYFVPVYEAKAQCTAQDVLRNRLSLVTAGTAPGSRGIVSSAGDVSVWKTIAIGTFKDPPAIRNAMSAIGCGIGNSAGEVLARPAFTVSSIRTDVDLVVISAAQLGFQGEAASLRKIYAHAQRLGFGLAEAELAPQLRLQYLDQPIGEFLIVATEPIKTWSGEPIILSVANGGAGLILIGQEAGDETEVPVTSRFVFVRPHDSQTPEATAFLK